jgi:hypothetical protein
MKVLSLRLSFTERNGLVNRTGKIKPVESKPFKKTTVINGAAMRLRSMKSLTMEIHTSNVKILDWIK